MSNSVLITGIFQVLLVGAAAVLIFKLIFKKSIMFKIIAVLAFPMLILNYLGFAVGILGMQHSVWATPLTVLIAFVGFAIVFRMLKRPLNEIINKVKLLSQGDLSISFDEKFLKGETEMAIVMHELSDVVSSFNKLAAFADHVGKGNLNVEYDLLGDNDTLGKAMLCMRANLQNAEMEMEKSRREDDRRNWATQGLAKFAELLRRDNDNLENLSQNVISQLVKYLDANQGGIFVLNDAENDADRVLEMKGCFAYDRKKFAEKQVCIGEGLVGTCFLEGEQIYLTDVPDSYISISSGLGDANPKAILICPLKVNDEIYGVVELASFQEFEPYQLDFVQKLSESIASTIGSVKVNIRTGKLLAQSKLQAEEMANQEEELPQNMEYMMTG